MAFLEGVRLAAVANDAFRASSKRSKNLKTFTGVRNTPMLLLGEGPSYSGERRQRAVRREVTIYIGPDGSRQMFEDHAGELLIDALVIDARGPEPRTARLITHDVDRLVTSLDRLLDDLSDPRHPAPRPSAIPSSLWRLLLRLRGRSASAAP